MATLAKLARKLRDFCENLTRKINDSADSRKLIPRNMDENVEPLRFNLQINSKKLFWVLEKLYTYYQKRKLYLYSFPTALISFKSLGVGFHSLVFYFLLSDSHYKLYSLSRCRNVIPCEMHFFCRTRKFILREIGHSMLSTKINT